MPLKSTVTQLGNFSTSINVSCPECVYMHHKPACSIPPSLQQKAQHVLSIVEIHLRWCKAMRGRRWPRPQGNFPLNPKYICMAKLTKWITVRRHTWGMLCGVRRSTCRGHPSWLMHYNCTTHCIFIASCIVPYLAVHILPASKHMVQIINPCLFWVLFILVN